MKFEEAFLRGIDSEIIRTILTDKISHREPFTEEDVMKLVIYPLTYKGRKAKQGAVTEAIDIAEGISDENTQRMALSGILVFADKIITDDDAERVTRRLDMTKVGRILQEREDKAIKRL